MAGARDLTGRQGPRKCERVGVLGGTFDPIHIAHLVAALGALHALDLDRVLLVVAGDPWQKRETVAASAADRLAMTRAAVDGLDGLEVSAVEVGRPGPTYTIDTLRALRAADRELFLIVGSDVAARIDTWHEAEAVRDAATLVVVSRHADGTDLDSGHGAPVFVRIPRLERPAGPSRPRRADRRPRARGGGARDPREASLHSHVMSAPRDGSGTAARGDTEETDAEDTDTQREQPERTPRGRLERVRRDHRQQAAVVVIAIVAGLIAGTLGSPRDHAARALAPESPTTIARGTGTAAHRTVLIAHVDAAHRVDLLAVAGVGAGGRVGSLVFVPTTTLVEVPSFDTQALVDVVRLGGSSLLTTTMSNALGLHFNEVMILNNARLTALLAPAARLRVTFVRSVQVDDRGGTLAFSPGRATISAADATRVLIGPASGGSLEHLVAVQAVLQGWFARLRVASVAHATLQVTAAASSLVALAHADIGFDTMPVDVLSSGSVTRYELQEPEADALVRADFPYGLIVKRKRLRVEVLNGTGAVALTQAVARRIVPAGGEITLTGNVPGFGVRHTSIVYYRPGDLAAARRLATALGVGSVAQGNVPIDVVDLTLVVGSDFHPTRS